MGVLPRWGGPPAEPFALPARPHGALPERRVVPLRGPRAPKCSAHGRLLSPPPSLALYAVWFLAWRGVRSRGQPCLIAARPTPCWSPGPVERAFPVARAAAEGHWQERDPLIPWACALPATPGERAALGEGHSGSCCLLRPGAGAEEGSGSGPGPGEPALARGWPACDGPGVAAPLGPAQEPVLSGGHFAHGDIHRSGCHSHTFCWLESQRSGACQWAPSRSVSDVQSVFRGFALSRSPPAGLTSPVLGTAPGGTLFPGVPSLRWRAGPPCQGGDGSPLRRSRWSPGPCRPGRQGAPSSCRRPSVRLPESALAREGAQR